MEGRRENRAQKGAAALSYRSKIVLLAVVAAAAPWLLCALLLPAHAAVRLAVGPGLVTAISLFLILRWLRPVSVAAEALAEHGTHSSGDEMERLVDGISDLSARFGALQHRWVQRHSVTGLPTREYLLAEIAEDIERAPSPGLLGVIRFAGYDRLSVFDPPQAELALKGFADRLSAALGKDRPLAHVDRDCFALWFRGVPPEAAVHELQAICYALGGEIEVGDEKMVPDIEVGAARFAQDGKDAAAILTRALVSLARPGASGKIDLSSGKSAHVARERFALEQDLRHAIAREQLQLHYQPVVDLAKGQLIGAEALIRWQHPSEGMMSPARFVPVLEDSDLVGEIGMWTLNAACREARGWQRRGFDGLKVAVNLSATQLRNRGLKQAIRRTLERHQLRPQDLELELTETAATEDAERTFSLFGELRAMGVSLAIDDFGSGYSSLSYLKNLPFDKLKIDREFVVKVHERSDSQAICRSLIELTRGLGLAILAEGVESLEEVEMLRRFGCTIFQGFYFSKPVCADEFVRLAGDPAWHRLIKSPVSRVQHSISNRMTA